MKRLTLRIAALALTVAGIGAAPALATHKWSSYHWARQSSQFTLTVVNNLDKDWSKFLVGDANVVGTVLQWNSPTDDRVLDAGATPRGTALTVMLAPSTTTGTGNCSAIAGRTVVCNGAFGNNGWLGLAQIWTSGGHISQGVAKMNDTYFSTSTYNNDNEKLHVVCQEVAHTFGLGHQSTSGQSIDTCMDYFSNTGSNAGSTKSTWPNRHDFGMLQSIYSAHIDTKTTLAKAAAAVAAVPADLPDPVAWGRLVAQSASGRHSNYERVFPNGVRVLTDVLWTPEMAAACPTCDHRNQRAP